MERKIALISPPPLQRASSRDTRPVERLARPCCGPPCLCLLTPGAALALVALSEAHVSLCRSHDLANGHVSLPKSPHLPSSSPSHVSGFARCLRAMPWAEGTGCVPRGHPQHDVPAGNAHPQAGFGGDPVPCRAVPAPAPGTSLPHHCREGNISAVTSIARWGQRKPVPGPSLSPRTTLSALWSPATCERRAVYHKA